MHHHGDFDPDGVAITARLTDLGVVPWRMSAADHLTARAAAERDGVELRPITAPVPATPWDPELQRVMTHAVDEERVMDGLLDEL